MGNRKTLFISPTLMYKDDLYSLEALLRDHISSKGYDFQIRGIEHGHEISAKPFHSLDELFSEKNLPRYLDQVSFETKEIEGEDKLVHCARINLDKRVSDIQLFSEKDDEWLTDFSQTLRGFFEQRRPWYWLVGMSIPPVFTISLGMALLMAVSAIVTKVDQAYVFPFLTALSGGLFMILGVTRVVFRHARICLFQKDKDNRANYELFAILTHITVLVVSTAGTFLMTTGKL